jgi:putative FmdB family regulatory protein
MPVYEFRCTDCNAHDDRFIRLADHGELSKKQRCAVCEGRMVQAITPVALFTDTRFMSGSDDGFGNDNHSRKLARQRAAEAGVSVEGMKYHPGLCRKGVSLDPHAWYGSMEEAKQKALSLGRCVEGSINARAPELDCENPLDKPYRVSDDCVQADVEEVVKRDHGGVVSEAKRREITEALIEKHSGSQD